MHHVCHAIIIYVLYAIPMLLLVPVTTVVLYKDNIMVLIHSGDASVCEKSNSEDKKMEMRVGARATCTRVWRNKYLAVPA